MSAQSLVWEWDYAYSERTVLLSTQPYSNWMCWRHCEEQGQPPSLCPLVSTSFRGQTPPGSYGIWQTREQAQRQRLKSRTSKKWNHNFSLIFAKWRSSSINWDQTGSPLDQDGDCYSGQQMTGNSCLCWYTHCRNIKYWKQRRGVNKAMDNVRINNNVTGRLMQ